MEKENSAEKILENIFGIVQELYEDMRSGNIGAVNHGRVFKKFAELGRTLVGADRASFWYRDKKNRRLITTAATGTEPISIPEDTGLVGRALAENRTVITNDPYHHSDFNDSVDKQTGYKTKSILVMPVSNCRGEIIGAFQAINKLTDENGFNDAEDVKRLTVAAFICGMALESDIFLAKSERDKLTGLKNRFGFQSDYNTKYKSLPDDAARPAIIICDIDHFKKANDTYGHNGGDAVLVHVAKTLREVVGDGADVYRWGGEEFIILPKRSDIAGAVETAEKMRVAVEKSVCRFEDKDIKITMSFGCAEFENGRTLEENIATADERLYRAKNGGRNRVVSQA